MVNKFVRPTIFLSACIEFESCRYDGEMIRDDYVRRLLDYVDIVRVCPELSIGLGAPREAVRLVEKKGETTKLLSVKNGFDYTKKMEDFSEKYVEKLKKKNVDGFILKAKSPTCGIRNVKVYKDIGKANVVHAKNDGLFAKRILDNFNNVPVETERRLSNYKIRDHFYIYLFTLADFNRIDINMKSLVSFHSKNKYLFMTYNQTKLKVLGNIVANHGKLKVTTLFEQYYDALTRLLQSATSMKKRVNVMTHIYGYFKNQLNALEKEYYFEVLNQYMNSSVPYSNVYAVLKGWVIRFNEAYLNSQTVFEPYPKELIQVTDSGKKI